MCWRTSASGKFVTHYSLWAMEKLHLIPSGTYDICETLKLAGDACVAGGKEKLFTPLYIVICRKPL